MSGGRIKACQVTLLSEDNRTIGRGIFPIDVEEGAPEIIEWEGGTFLRIRGVLLYRKTRVMRASANFEAVA